MADEEESGGFIVGSGGGRGRGRGGGVPVLPAGGQFPKANLLCYIYILISTHFRYLERIK
jgi:hypothetical protein